MAANPTPERDETLTLSDLLVAAEHAAELADLRAKLASAEQRAAQAEATAPVVHASGRWLCPSCREIASKRRDTVVEHMTRCVRSPLRHGAK